MDRLDRTLVALRAAMVRAAGPDTAYPPLRHRWRSGTLDEHCGPVAYALRELLGWEVVSGRDAYGVRQVLNVRPDGAAVCLAYEDPTAIPARVRPCELKHPRFERFLDRTKKNLGAAA